MERSFSRRTLLAAGTAAAMTAAAASVALADESQTAAPLGTVDPETGRYIPSFVGLYGSGNCSGPWCGEVYITGAGQPNALWCSSRATRHAMKNVFGLDVPENWMGDVAPEDIEIPVGVFPEKYAHVEVDVATGRAR